MENIVLLIKSNCENIFISNFEKFPNFFFNNYIVVFENDIYNGKFKLEKKYSKPNIKVYEYKTQTFNSNAKVKLGEPMYELSAKINGKIFFVFIDENIQYIVDCLNKKLQINYPIDLTHSAKYSSFSRQINKINNKLLEKTFCYNYIDKILNSQYYKLNMLIVDSKALWVKKLLFELKYLSLSYVESFNEFVFLINFLYRKYIYHYN